MLLFFGSGKAVVVLWEWQGIVRFVHLQPAVCQVHLPTQNTQPPSCDVTLGSVLSLVFQRLQKASAWDFWGGLKRL